jgi:hypothetical protein
LQCELMQIRLRVSWFYPMLSGLMSASMSAALFNKENVLCAHLKRHK